MAFSKQKNENYANARFAISSNDDEDYNRDLSGNRGSVHKRNHLANRFSNDRRHPPERQHNERRAFRRPDNERQYNNNWRQQRPNQLQRREPINKPKKTHEDSDTEELEKWKHDLYQEKPHLEKYGSDDFILLVKEEQEKFNKAYEKLLEKHIKKLEKIHAMSGFVIEKSAKLTSAHQRPSPSVPQSSWRKEAFTKRFLPEDKAPEMQHRPPMARRSRENSRESSMRSASFRKQPLDALHKPNTPDHIGRKNSGNRNAKPSWAADEERSVEQHRAKVNDGRRDRNFSRRNDHNHNGAEWNKSRRDETRSHNSDERKPAKPKREEKKVEIKEVDSVVNEDAPEEKTWAVKDEKETEEFGEVEFGEKDDPVCFDVDENVKDQKEEENEDFKFESPDDSESSTAKKAESKALEERTANNSEKEKVKTDEALNTQPPQDLVFQKCVEECETENGDQETNIKSTDEDEELPSFVETNNENEESQIDKSFVKTAEETKAEDKVVEIVVDSDDKPKAEDKVVEIVVDSDDEPKAKDKVVEIDIDSDDKPKAVNKESVAETVVDNDGEPKAKDKDDSMVVVVQKVEFPSFKVEKAEIANFVASEPIDVCEDTNKDK